MKIALITGANRGLGAGLTNILAAKGYKVYAASRTIDPFVVEGAVSVALDVTDDDSIAEVVSQIRREDGHLDLLINNAGLNKDTATSNQKELVSKLSELDRDMLLEMFNVNAVSPLMVTKACIEIMTEPDAFVVNIASDRASFSDDGGETANYGYRASKVALRMETQALLTDLPDNVSAFSVHPGSVLTDMNPEGDISPEESAASIVGILDSWKSALNGQFLQRDGRIYE